MDDITVVILHYKNGEDTRECLESLLRGEYGNKPFRIIVVINSDNDGFSNVLKRDYPLVETIINPENLGFAGGNNIGLKEAFKKGCRYVLLLNNDVIVSGDLITGILKEARKDDHIGLISPKILFAKGFEYRPERYTKDELGKVLWYAGGVIDWKNIYMSHRGVDEVDNRQYEDTIETDFATGCCMLVSEDVYKKIGLLDEKYFMYFEDVDYSIKAKRAGFKVLYTPKTKIWHKNANSSGKPGSTLHVYYQTRNRMYFGMKYASWKTKKSLFLESMKLIFKGGIYQKAIIDYYRYSMGKES